MYFLNEVCNTCDVDMCKCIVAAIILEELMYSHTERTCYAYCEDMLCLCMQEIQEIVMTDEQSGNRLDKALSELIKLSRHHTAILIRSGHVLDMQNRPITKASLIVQSGMCMKILPMKQMQNNIIHNSAHATKLNIIYEDEFLLIADKPHGQPSHPSAGHITDTLLDSAIAYFQNNNIKMNTFNGQPALINRLDMDTSGLILIAKDDVIHNHIKQQFSDRTTVKMYKARVHNIEKLPECFCLEGYIGPSSTKKELMHAYDAKMYKSAPEMYADLQHALQAKWHQKLTEMVNANERQITLDYGKTFPEHVEHKYVQTAYKYAFMECMKSQSIHDQKDTILCVPHTGRQHQIRVQLLQANAPILGDPLYSKDDFSPLQLRSVFINFFHFHKQCFVSVYNP